MRRALIASTFAVLVAAPAVASDGEIGIFGDVNATVTTVNVPCGESATLYVYALQEGASAPGLTGAEYAIALFGSGGFVFVEQANPTADVVSGHAFPPYDGTRIFWNACQNSRLSRVLLGTVLAFNTGCAGGSTVLQVVAPAEPTNPFFQCPNLTLCDAPVFTRVCAGNVSVGTCPFPPFPPTCQFSSGGSLTLTTDPVSVGPGAGRPGAVEFGDPMPNPSTGAVRFPIGLPEAAVVSLRVHDPGGREIARVDGHCAAGRHMIAWDGFARTARPGPGVYFASLFVDGEAIGGRRMVFMR